MLQKHEQIDNEQTLMVNFNKFSESSIDFYLHFYKDNRLDLFS